MIEIDGGFGEGGGQILRTALGLSCLFRKPFRIFNIRKGRKKPGLMPQHLTGVRAAKLISDAEAEGDTPESTDLLFSPGKVKGGDFFFDTGTAGSTLLVLQTLLPPLVFLNQKTSLVLKGGTHVPFSPSYHYISGVFAPMVGRLGVKLRASIESYGFYPKGGGNVRADIFPAGEIRPFKSTERGGIVRLRGYSAVGKLPLSIAERQRDAAAARLRRHEGTSALPLEIELLDAPTPGRGTFFHLESESENSIAGFTSLGERGKRAEAVGEEAVDAFFQYYATNAALDPHLADQMVIYLSLCGDQSEFTTSQITQHLLTNLRAIGLFHEFRYSVEGEIGKPGKVKINS